MAEDEDAYYVIGACWGGLAEGTRRTRLAAVLPPTSAYLNPADAFLRSPPRWLLSQHHPSNSRT